MAYVFKLRASIKNYEWGKHGLSSAVALLSSELDDFKVDEKSPYAELWIGTHSSGPAIIPKLNEMKLIDWLEMNPQSLGSHITNSFETSTGLPFLFKVLSVNKPLSIQAHPDIQTAKKLYKKFPDRYPDDNHKPEMAIALTDFKALCGFRPISEITTFMKEVPHLQEMVGSKIANDFLNSGEDLKSLFTAVMTCSPDAFQPLLAQIVECFEHNHFKHELCISIKDLFLKTHIQYPGDIGCFCLFFLNYLELKPGEALFLAANEPHAYLYGDCIECMACSDNVIRAGLTPKFRDVQTLCNILTYNCKTSEENKFPHVTDPEDPYVKIYDPPVREFVVDSISLENKKGSYALKVLQSASVLLVVKGTAKYEYEGNEDDLVRGSILFIGSGCQVDVRESNGILMFRAYCKV